jgi:hypothetical protein
MFAQKNSLTWHNQSTHGIQRPQSDSKYVIHKKGKLAFVPELACRMSVFFCTSRHRASCPGSHKQQQQQQQNQQQHHQQQQQQQRQQQQRYEVN